MTSTMKGSGPSPYTSGCAGSGGVSGASAAMDDSVGLAPLGFLSGAPSCAFRLKSARFRAPFTCSSS